MPLILVYRSLPETDPKGLVCPMQSYSLKSHPGGQEFEDSQRQAGKPKSGAQVATLPDHLYFHSIS